MAYRPSARWAGRSRNSVWPSADFGIRRLRRAQPGRHPRPPRRRDGPRDHRHRRRPERRPQGRHRHFRTRCPHSDQGRRHRSAVHRQHRHRPASPPDPRQPSTGRLRQSQHAADVCLQARQGPVPPRTKDTSSLDRCVSTCANIARTDQHAAGVRRRATVLDQRAAQVPGPLGERLRSNAGRLRDLADAHYRTRTTLQDSTA